MRKLAVLAILLGLGSPAFAQAPGEVQPLSEPAQPSEPKSPGTAVAISVGVTLGGVVMIAGASHSAGAVGLGLLGMYVGPSTGQWYAGQFGGLGLAARAVSAYAIVKGIGMVDNSCETFTTGSSCAQVNREHDQGAMLIYGGMALWAGSTIYDFVAAHRATSRWNREHATSVSMSVSPTFMTSNGSQTTGLVLSGSF